ncbi:MAG: phage major tail protein, TP901-1 family, partial [Pseudomonadota bacterium]
GQWRELLAGAGLRSASVSGSGIFKDAASDAALRRVFFDGDTPDFQIVIPDFGTMEGAFQVASIEYAGNHDGEASFEIALVSAGELVFTEAA